MKCSIRSDARHQLVLLSTLDESHILEEFSYGKLESSDQGIDRQRTDYVGSGRQRMRVIGIGCRGPSSMGSRFFGYCKKDHASRREYRGDGRRRRESKARRSSSESIRDPSPRR